MIATLARLLERYFGLPSESMIPILSRTAVLTASAAFLLLATVIVAFEHIFIGQSVIDGLQVGTVATEDIHAPETRTYVSQVLTDQRRADASAAVRPVYNPPDLSVVRTQTRLAGQILDFIDNVRHDNFATVEQQANDLRKITALTLDDDIIQQILALEDEIWQDFRNEVVRLLEQVMQESLRDVDLQATRDRLAVQTSLRFDEVQVAAIVAIVEDLVRPNTSENIEATERARQEAIANVPDEPRNFQRGQIVIRAGAQIGALEYEALERLGLLQPPDRRWQEIGRSLIMVVIVATMMGLYLGRFNPSLLYSEPRMLVLLAVIFLLLLAGIRFASGNEIYLFPASILALLYVAIISSHVALMGVVGLALLAGVMVDNSLEVATVIITSGTVAALTLRRPERLNSYFVTGLLVALIEMTVAAVFHLVMPDGVSTVELPVLMLYGVLNGILTAATSVVGLYLIGLVFNLPTALKLIELSQPNQPLLQRLLREAPGTYQHSLQVANLSEQAANAIGANAVIAHVAALYHDIGKVLNPAFFTENQRDTGNPHDTLNDPYRSADIIISHVTEGDAMARQYRLPKRLRDFIKEHHGTTQVYVFYRQAVAIMGDNESAVDIKDFTYPGPRPQSRETAILMLADSCEATIRSMQPGSKQEIEEAVERVIDNKRREGQLDDSGLTLNDLSIIKRIFVDMLKATFHPRINYSEAVARARGTIPSPLSTPAPVTTTRTAPVTTARTSKPDDKVPTEQRIPPVKSRPAKSDYHPELLDDDDDTPLPYVPLLPRTNGKGKETTEGKSIAPEDSGAASPKPDEADVADPTKTEDTPTTDDKS